MGYFKMFQGVTGHFYYLGNGTSYALGEGTLYIFSWKREILSSGTIVSSGNRDTYPLGFGTSSGKRETGHAIFWDSGHLSSGKTLFGG